MITLCWAAKGGSGTTVVAAALALGATRQTLLVDLDGDLPAVFGIGDETGPGVEDWLASDAPADRLDALTTGLTDLVGLLPRGRHADGGRWPELAGALARRPGDVVVDAGTGTPPGPLHQVADRNWLVTRACYLSIRRAGSQLLRPDGVVLVEEPGRALGVDDVEAAIGAPVVTRVLVDPAVARAVDAGLLLARLPRPFRRALATTGA
jgi:hypothetical protein